MAFPRQHAVVPHQLLSLCFSFQLGNVVMAKRSHEHQESDDRSAKRLRPSDPDRLSHLSYELLLRTLSYLSVSDLVLCQRCAVKNVTLNLLTDYSDCLTASTPCPEILSCGRLFSTTALFAPGLLGYQAFETRNSRQSLFTTRPRYPNGSMMPIL